jgi:phosphatidylglycerophosphate synthase
VRRTRLPRRGPTRLVVNAKILPNLLSGIRIALMPVVLMIAWADSRLWFVIVLSFSLLTDALDGFFARRYNAFSEFGRKLDSVADYLTLIAGIAGIALLWPDIMHREWVWVATGLAVFFSVMAYGLVRLRRIPCYHTWTTKVGVAGCALSLIPLLADTTPLPFHLAMLVLMLGGLEEVIIMHLVPGHVGEMPSAWHAWRLRKTNRAASTPREPYVTVDTPTDPGASP